MAAASSNRTIAIPTDPLTQQVRSVANELHCFSQLGCSQIDSNQLFVKKASFPFTESFIVSDEETHLITLGPAFSKALEGKGNVAFTLDEARGVIAHEISHAMLSHTQNSTLSVRERELQADAHTLQRPSLAQGLRNALDRMLWGYGEDWEEMQLENGYPALSERIQQLDGELCKLYLDPDYNHSICASLGFPIWIPRRDH